VDLLHGAHRLVKEDLRARPGDRDYTVFFMLDSGIRSLADRPGWQRWEHVAAVVAMPDAVPVGLTAFAGTPFQTASAGGPGRSTEDQGAVVARAVERFLLQGPFPK
jgi:hypothetical protein